MKPDIQRLPRLFFESMPEQGQRVELPATAAAHVRVLRLSSGAEVELFDAAGGVASAELLSSQTGPPQVLVGPVRQLPPPAASLTLVACLPRGGKLDDVVRVLTELGVSELRLAHSERSVAAGSDLTGRLSRWRRIANEACAQSGQPRAPQIEPPAPLSVAADAAPADAMKLVFWERAETPLGSLTWPDSSGGAVWAVVGPEGGLSEGEISALRAQGYTPIGLGPTILRAETAVIAVSTLLLDRMGRLS